MKPTNIFVKTSDSIDLVASEVGAALGVALARVEADGEVYFEAANDIETISIFANDYEDLPGLPLSQYQVDVEVIGYYDDARRLRRARALFDALRRLKRYPLLLADNAERKLDEYEPTKS